MKDISGIKALLRKYPDSDLLKSIQELPDIISESEFSELVPLWDLLAGNEKNKVSVGTLTKGKGVSDTLHEISLTQI